MHTETKQEKDEEAHAGHLLMMLQRTNEGGTGIYKRGFLGIMREAQLCVTLLCNFVMLINESGGCSSINDE